MERPRFRPDEAIVPAAFAGLVLVACLSPVHNDTWWHLAYGREMAQRGGFGQVDWFSHTAWGQPFANHQWLGQRLLHALLTIGGLPLVTGFCAALIAGAWGLLWRMTRGPLADRLLILAAAVMSSTLIWSVRPQVFTVAFLPLTAWLLARDRLVFVPALVLLWANLHGGVLLGIVLTGCALASAVLWNRKRIAGRALCLAASAGATLITPLGWRYWPEIVASLRRSQTNRIHEWQQTPLPPEHLFFWGLGAALVWLAWRSRRRLSEPDALYVLWALALLPSAIRTLRNIAPFAMMAAPALTRLLHVPAGHGDTEATEHARRTISSVPLHEDQALHAPAAGHRDTEATESARRTVSSVRLHDDAPATPAGHRGAEVTEHAQRVIPPRTLVRAGVGIVAGLAVAAGVALAWSAPIARLGWAPVSAAAAAAIAACPDPLYNRYADGGPIIWFVPGKRVFLDSRQDQYPSRLIADADRAEATGEYATLFAEHGIACAALPPSSAVAQALRQDGWRVRFADDRWAVLERPGTAARSAPPLPAP